MGTFTAAEETDIRRHCGYGAIGDISSMSAGGMGARYFQQFSQFEFRINNLSPTEEAIVRLKVYGTAVAPAPTTNGLNFLELAIETSSANLDTDEASVWKHNKREIDDRYKLYTNARQRLCETIGVAYGPAIVGGTITTASTIPVIV